MYRYTAAAFAFALLAAPSHGASTSGSASVKVLQAVTVAKGADLDFGKVIPGTAAATVRIAEDGTRTCGTGLTCIGTPTAALFNITGTTGETVGVTIAVARINLTSGSAPAMTVDLATTTPSVVMVAGKGSFKVSGLLTVGANQAAGAYTGTFTVNVDYQ